MLEKIELFTAFSGGLVSFLSPCVLPLIPAYISYITGSTIEELNSGNRKLSTLYKSLGFVIGFSIVFILMGLSISSIGKIFSNELVQQIGGIVIIIMGLHITGLFKIKQLYKDKKIIPMGSKKVQIGGSVLIGMFFAAGWTPCIGPILTSILVFAGNMETILEGVLLLVLYSLGFAIPFIITALTIEHFSKYYKKISRFLKPISIISGILLIILGVLMFTDKLNVLTVFFTNLLN